MLICALCVCFLSAELFTWALDKPISDEEARECACRQPGRSWHINETKLSEMGELAGNPT